MSVIYDLFKTFNNYLVTAKNQNDFSQKLFKSPLSFEILSNVCQKIFHDSKVHKIKLKVLKRF